MKTVKMKLSALKLPERNVRMHTDKQLKEFERSITMFGQIRPIVTDENGVILAGNGLYEALKRMNRTEADVLKVTGLSENQKKKLMLADNKIFGLGVDDLSALDAFLADLKDDLDIPGFDEDLLRSMAAEASAVTEQLQEYGTLDPGEIENIRAAGERKATYMETGLHRRNPGNFPRKRRTGTPFSGTRNPSGGLSYVPTAGVRYGYKAHSFGHGRGDCRENPYPQRVRQRRPRVYVLFRRQGQPVVGAVGFEPDSKRGD